MRIAVTLVLTMILGATGLLWGWSNAIADPIVRRAAFSLPGWPTGTPPVRVVLLSDIHIGTFAMDADRLTRVVGQVNALEPDLVLIAGDFIFGHDPADAAKLGEPMVVPLSKLRAPLGVVAVPGNHDHWTGLATVRDQLRRAGVTVIENEAIRRGPLAIGGVGDDFSRHDNVPNTLAAVRALPGARVLLTHSPDIAPSLPRDTPLLLAGHTHCSQLVFPLYGPLLDVSRYGARYRCGLKVEPGRAVVVTSGLGTSGPPIRIGAPPDLWLLTLGP